MLIANLQKNALFKIENIIIQFQAFQGRIQTNQWSLSVV